MAELMPISRPLESSSGPPELPGLIAASVWIMCSRAPLPSSWGSARSRAETMPVVSDQSRPNGLPMARSEEHTSELQSQSNLVCRLLLEKKKKYKKTIYRTHLL